MTPTPIPVVTPTYGVSDKGDSSIAYQISRVSDLSDEERERHIQSCGWLMQDAWDRWYQTGDFGARGEADRWRILMEEAIKARSPEQVARMEKERGLA